MGSAPFRFDDPAAELGSPEGFARLQRLHTTRALTLPAGARVVGVGGDTLGGAGRTPLAVALATAFAGRAVFVGHGFGAATGRPRWVEPDSACEDVGDEARIALRALLPWRVPVVVARDRGEALRAAATRGDVLIVDRLLQARPHRLACSVLASRRAVPRRWFAEMADLVVRVGSCEAEDRCWLSSPPPARFGLVSSMAGGGRARGALAALGLHPIVHVVRRDHAPLGTLAARCLVRVARRARLDGWVCDQKTDALRGGLSLGPVVQVLEHEVLLAPSLIERVRAFVGDPG